MSPTPGTVPDRELTAVQKGREVVRRFTLTELIALADTLGLDPADVNGNATLPAAS